MEHRLRVAVVGIGFGQAVLIPALRAAERCEVVAVCASTSERAARVADRLGIPRAHSDWRALLGPDIDALAIAVPPALQPQIIVAAADAGKHVFCEKPLALDVADAERAAAAVLAASVANAVDLEFGELPAWRAAHELLVGRGVGTLRRFAITWRVRTAAHVRPTGSWKMRAASGGGALYGFTPHVVYLVERLLGPVARVAARVEDEAVDAWLELADGTPGTVSIATDAAQGPGHSFEVYGSATTLRLTNPTSDHARNFRLEVGTVNGGLAPVTLDPDTAGADGRLPAVSAIARRFVDAALGGPPAYPDIRDGLRVQRLLQAMSEASRTRTWCDV